MTTDIADANYASLLTFTINCTISVDELIKKANDEYIAIHQHDKMDFSRAIIIGEVLNELKQRKIVPHKQWQGYLKSKWVCIYTPHHHTHPPYRKQAGPNGQKSSQMVMSACKMVISECKRRAGSVYLGLRLAKKPGIEKTFCPEFGCFWPIAGQKVFT